MTVAEELIQREPGLARIIETIEQIGSLPTIPVVAQHVMALAGNERSSMRQIAEVIAQDQALAAKVLKVVNSAHYGLRQSVGTLPLALTILGVREIMHLVLGISVISAFPDAPDSDLFSQRSLWRTSARCACVARKLAHSTGLAHLGSEAFLAGLVRDIGVVVLHQYLHTDFMRIAHSAERDGLALPEAEARHLGATHAGIGAWLAGEWAFPAPLVEAIALHHCPSESSWNPPLAALVYLAGRILDDYTREASKEEAAATLEADPVWQQLISSVTLGRTSSTADLLDAVSDAIEAAPLFLV